MEDLIARLADALEVAEARAAEAEAARDAALAVIEKARGELAKPINLSVVFDTHAGRALWEATLADAARRILSSAPADVLRERDRQVAERAWDAAVEETHALGWLHDFAKSDALARNPYRTEEEN